MHKYKSSSHIYTSRCTNISSSHIYTSRWTYINQVRTYTYQSVDVYVCELDLYLCILIVYVGAWFIFVHLDMYMCELDLYLCILMCICANLIYSCGSWYVYVQTWFIFVHLDVYLCGLDLYLCILMRTCVNLIYICASWCVFVQTWFIFVGLDMYMCEFDTSVHLDVNLQILMFCPIRKSIKSRQENNTIWMSTFFGGDHPSYLLISSLFRPVVLNTSSRIHVFHNSNPTSESADITLSLVVASNKWVVGETGQGDSQIQTEILHPFATTRAFRQIRYRFDISFR